MTTALQLLRDYLDESGFAALYRYIVPSPTYACTPLAINWRSREAVIARDLYLEGELRGRRLLWTLMACEPVRRTSLTAAEIRVAEALAADGLLALDEVGVRTTTRQLICFDQLYLFIDSRLNFPSRTAMHEVYTGVDTASLAYYLGGVHIDRDTRGLDLGTGSGALALAMAARGASVVATDIADPALKLAAINRALNRLDDRVEIRRQPFEDTLAAPATWDVITFNPPFIAAPPEVPLPLFARGTGRDGLDLMRAAIARLPALLSARGNALFVADLLGGPRLPLVADELRELARDFAVELFIDDVRPIQGHIEALARGAVMVQPELDLDVLRASIHQLLVTELGASHLHLAVIRVRRGPPGLLACNRRFSVTQA